MKKLFMVSVLVLVVALSGCKEKSDEEKFQDIILAFDEVSNCRFTIDNDIEFHGPGGTLSYQQNFDMDYVDDKMYGTFRTDMLTNELMNFEMYMVENKDNDAIDVYTKYLGEWTYSEEENDEDISTTGNTDLDLSKYETLTAEKDGSTTVYTLILLSDGFENLYDEAMVFLNGSEVQIDESATLLVKVYVKDKSITKVTTDLASSVSDYFVNKYGVTVDEYSYVYEYSDYGQVDQIIIPKDVSDLKN